MLDWQGGGRETYITSTSRISIFVPRAADLRVLLVYCELKIGYVLWEENGCCYTTDAGTDIDDFEGARVIDGSFCNEWVRIV